MLFTAFSYYLNYVYGYVSYVIVYLGDKMKKMWLLVAMVFIVMISFDVKSDGNNKLVCNPNGDFAILVVSDPQCDNEIQWHEARDELEILVKRANPDFVLINGDMNSHNKISHDMWDLFISPLESRNICWSTTNGNHDPFNIKNFRMYKSYQNCLNNIVSSSDKNYEKNRPMNYMIPIFSNDAKQIVFAVYGMDSGTKSNGKYEGLTVKQIEWYKAQSDKLKQNNNARAVTSVLCMHIPLPQMLEMYYEGDTTIYGVANEINYNPMGYTTLQGKKIDKINIHTSSIEYDNKMFEAILKNGDVKALLFGHNHRNNFIGSYKGVLLGFVGKLSTGCYSDILCRGGRVIRFNQSSPQNFTVEWLGAVDGAIDQPPIHADGKISK